MLAAIPHPFTNRRDGGGAHLYPTVSAEVVSAALDEIDYGVVLLDRTDSIVLANHAARELLSEGRVLCSTGGTLHCFRRGDALKLQSALSEARRGLRRLLTLGEPPAQVSLAAVSLPDRGTVQLVFGRHSCCELSVTAYARQHGLTAAEMDVLRALCMGLAPAAIAAHHGVSVATIRTQITCIRSKTYARSIQALTRAVSLLPPIVGCVRDAHLEVVPV